VRNTQPGRMALSTAAGAASSQAVTYGNQVFEVEKCVYILMPRQ